MATDLSLSFWAFETLFRQGSGVADKGLYLALIRNPSKRMLLKAEYLTATTGRLLLFLDQAEAAAWASPPMALPVSRRATRVRNSGVKFLSEPMQEWRKAHAGCFPSNSSRIVLWRKGQRFRHRKVVDLQLKCPHCQASTPWSYVWADGSVSWAPFVGVDPVAKCRRSPTWLRRRRRGARRREAMLMEADVPEPPELELISMVHRETGEVIYFAADGHVSPWTEDGQMNERSISYRQLLTDFVLVPGQEDTQPEDPVETSSRYEVLTEEGNENEEQRETQEVEDEALTGDEGPQPSEAAGGPGDVRSGQG